jgi:hypothetical protein
MVQEAFFRAFPSPGILARRSELPGWLFRIGSNLRKDSIVRNAGRVHMSIEDHEIADHSDPLGEAGASEMEARLHHGLRVLPRLNGRCSSSGPAGYGLRGISVPPWAQTPGAARGALPPRGQATQGTDAMSGAHIDSDRLAESVHGEIIWTTAEAGILPTVPSAGSSSTSSARPAGWARPSWLDWTRREWARGARPPARHSAVEAPVGSVARRSGPAGGCDLAVFLGCRGARPPGRRGLGIGPHGERPARAGWA